MIVSVHDFLVSWELPINFVCHSAIFIGTIYSAIHCRFLSDWFITPLWYIGLMSLFVATTIVCEWTLGSEFYLSYSNIGGLGEILSNIILAVMCLYLFNDTIKQDIKSKKLRK